jgi:hypothetical protein
LVTSVLASLDGTRPRMSFAGMRPGAEDVAAEPAGAADGDWATAGPASAAATSATPAMDETIRRRFIDRSSLIEIGSSSPTSGGAHGS